MSEVADHITKFVEYAATLKGDEKGEAQVFCDRLFRGFGWGGYKEAGATLEDRIKKEGRQFVASRLEAVAQLASRPSAVRLYS